MINIISICDSSSFLQVIQLVKIIINSISIIVPVLLLLSCSLSAVSEILGDGKNAPKNILTAWKNKAIAAVIIFMIPTFVNIVIDMTSGDFEFKTCLTNANSSYISQLRSQEEAVKKIKEEKRKELYEKSKSSGTKILQHESAPDSDIPSNYGNEVDGGYGDGGENTYVPGKTVSGSSISKIDTTDLGCTLYYSDHSTVFSILRVNSEITSQVHGILTNVCSYRNRTSWVGQLETAGAYVDKGGYHGRGLAIDLFNNWTYTYNGKDYHPYQSMGPTTFKHYTQFICDVCGGVEDCQYNINYQIYKNYFQPLGWCWGGDWTAQYFDPMHYEYSGSCGTMSHTNRISCGG